MKKNKIDELKINMRHLDADDRDDINRTLEGLKEKYSIRRDSDFKFRFKDFKLFSYYSDVDMGYVFHFDNGKGNYKITFTRVVYEFIGEKGRNYTGSEYQIWGIATLRKDFGHVLITRESIVEKVVEWFRPVELDFPEDPEFSKKVWVVAKDKDKAALAIDFQFRNAILNIKRSDFLIEIINNKLIIGNRKIVNAETMESFIDFLNCSPLTSNINTTAANRVYKSWLVFSL